MATIARVFWAVLAAVSILPSAGCSRTSEAGPMRLAASIEGPGSRGVNEAAAAERPVPQPLDAPKTPDSFPRVRLETTLGAMILELRPDWAPETAQNFEYYVRRNHYDGTIFHAVARDRSIVAGRYTVDLRERTDALRPPIRNEARACAERGIKNERGMVGMMRKPENAHTAQCEFYVNVVNNPHLDYRKPTDAEYGYCVFGRIVAGMEVADAIAQIQNKDERRGETVFNQLPQTEVMIRSARLIR